jgi:osmoprotectant transport system substrate-binding protein
MKRLLIRPFWALALVLALVLVAAACGDDDDDDDTSGADTTTESSATETSAGSTSETTAGEAAPVDGPTVVVGSFNFPESELLGELYGQALEAKGITVERKPALGNREVVQPALESGEINLVAEYAATSLEFVNGAAGEATSDPAETVELLNAALADLSLTALDPSPAQDQNGFVVTQETADEYSLATLSDLAAVAGDLVLGGPPECETRPFCALGLEETYGIEFAEIRSLDAGGPLTVQALEGGQIDVGLIFTSDATIVDKGWVLLEDDQGLQLADNVVPVVSQELVDAYGATLTDTLNAVSAALDTAGLTELNSLVAGGEETADVAATWLADHGLA